MNTLSKAVFMRLQFLHNANFGKLWVGQTISAFGSEVTAFALPLIAAIALHATPVQMGILNAVQFTPFLLIGLFAGVWVDRVPRRPILIGADLGRALLLGSIPILALLNRLNIEFLYSIAFCVGVLTVFFDVAYHSFLPVLVKREELMAGNSKLFASRSAVQTIAPGLAGSLMQLLSAPMLMSVDAVSFLISALSLSSIRCSESISIPSNQRLWRDLREGLQFMFQHSIIRALTLCFTVLNLFFYMISSVQILYLTRDLMLQPAGIGVIFTTSSIGTLIGTVFAGRVARVLGLGQTLISTLLLCGLGYLCIPLIQGSTRIVVVLLSLAGFVSGLTGMINNIHQLSLRQALAPDHLQGRTNANMRFLVWGVRPIGALLGGVLGERIGVQETLFVGAVGMLLSVLWLVFSPVRRLRNLSTSQFSTSI